MSGRGRRHRLRPLSGVGPAKLLGQGGSERPVISVAVRVSVERGPHAGVDRRDVVRRARAMLDAVQMKNQELSILLTDDNQIEVLNRIYRKKNRPTDVLAFAQREGPTGDRQDRLLGDVVVSVPTARRQAEARGVNVTAEVTMLVAHGLLHLLGWDHDTPARDRRMRRETERLCAAADAASGGASGARPLRGRTPVKGRTRGVPIAIRRRSTARGPGRQR